MNPATRRGLPQPLRKRRTRYRHRPHFPLWIGVPCPAPVVGSGQNPIQAEGLIGPFRVEAKDNLAAAKPKYQFAFEINQTTSHLPPPPPSVLLGRERACRLHIKKAGFSAFPPGKARYISDGLSHFQIGSRASALFYRKSRPSRVDQLAYQATGLILLCLSPPNRPRVPQKPPLCHNRNKWYRLYELRAIIAATVIL